jgi:GNAT superfamily N-acetyltransferase
MDLVYRYQHEKAMADYEVGGGSMIKRPGSFKLKILSEFDPRLYEMYLNNVSNLTTLHDEFKVKPKILIATQAILFGKQACALANILYNIIQDPKANDMRGLCIQFTYTLLLAPVILHPSLIIQISNDNPLRREVWGHLGEMGYSDEQLAAFERYHLVVVDSIFDSSCAVCAFALLSHNVFVPASPEDPHELSNMIVMQHIEVRAAHQRCGIGGFLARAIRKIARGNGYHSIYVPETPQMQATANFWKCLGFKKSLFYEGWHALLLQGEQQLTSALA